MTDDRTVMEERLDRALAAWGRSEPGRAEDDAAVARILAHADAVSRTAARRPRALMPWLVGGGAVAASVAVALLLAPAPRGVPSAGAPAQLAAAVPDEGASFALLYTPTIEEELIL